MAKIIEGARNRTFPNATKARTLIKFRDRLIASPGLSPEVSDELNRRLIELLPGPLPFDPQKGIDLLRQIPRIPIGLAMRGYDHSELRKSFDAQFKVLVISDKAMEVMAGASDVEYGAAFNLNGYPVVSESMLAKARAGEKEALMVIRHEHRHNDYNCIHGFNRGDEQLFADEIFAHFASFVDVYGASQDEFAAIRGARMRKGKYFALVAGSLVNDYAAEIADKKSREALYVRIYIACFVCEKMITQSGSPNIVLEYLRTLTKIDHIIGMAPSKDMLDQLVSHYVGFFSANIPDWEMNDLEIKDYEELHQQYASFRRTFQER